MVLIRRLIQTLWYYYSVWYRHYGTTAVSDTDTMVLLIQRLIQTLWYHYSVWYRHYGTNTVSDTDTMVPLQRLIQTLWYQYSVWYRHYGTTAVHNWSLNMTFTYVWPAQRIVDINFRINRYTDKKWKQLSQIIHMCVWYAYTGHRTVNYSPHVFDQSSKQWFHYCWTCSFRPEYTVILLLMDCIFLVIRSRNSLHKYGS